MALIAVKMALIAAACNKF